MSDGGSTTEATHSPPEPEASTTGPSWPRLDDADGYRLLVVDDNPSIHDDFRRIFTSERPSGDGLDELAASVFGIERAPAEPLFSLDHVMQGQDALDRVLAARDGGRPYALLFMDVRMPPGWDGVEACARILGIDPDVHVVLCTAYAERGWRQRVEALGGRDRVLVLKKPFDIVEVQQLARALCERWTFARRDRVRMRELERSVTDQRGRLAAAAAHLRNEIASRTLAEDRLRKAQRLEGLGRLAAGLCHEINNPLSFIITSVELIELELASLADRLPRSSHEELAQLAHTIGVGAGRIMRIVGNIKMFARSSSQITERIDLEQAIEAAVGMVQPRLMPHVELHADVSQVLPVIGRRFELEQVLINLVENALHAMAEQHEPPARITLAVRRQGASMNIEVTDNGPGIEDAILDKIFDPFFTTKSVGKGTGLGLSICHTMTRSMGGQIGVRNNEDRGATFTVSLPLAPTDRTESTTPSATPRPDPTSPPGRILVIDDEPMVRSTLEKLLRPHTVVTSSNVQDALARCGTEDFDVILCDIIMPGLDGRDFHRMLAGLRPGAESRVVFITGGSMQDGIREFLEQTTNDYLEKPLDSVLLRRLIAERIEHRRAASRTLL